MQVTRYLAADINPLRLEVSDSLRVL